MKDGKVTVIPNENGNRVTPAYVAFTASGERHVGDVAKEQLTSNPENTVFDAKRLIGQNWDPELIQTLPFKVMNNRGIKHLPDIIVSGGQL